MFEYKFGNKIYKEGDKISAEGYGQGIVISPTQAVKENSKCCGNGNIYVYIKFNNGDVLGLHNTKKIKILNTAFSSSVPRNNDGRKDCFWCKIPTQKRGGGKYDVCPKCGL